MKVLFSGGGTGGHINPALALAEHIKLHEPYSDVRFAGASGGMEETLVRREGYRLYTLPIHGLRRGVSLGDIRYNAVSLYQAVSAVRKARKILREFRPDVVVGTGGYASFPALYAAIREKIPTALLEVNAMPGAVVRALSGRVSMVFLSFPETADYLKDPQKAVLTGNPLRCAIAAVSREDAKKNLKMTDKPLVVSFWGSLGAAGMNKKMIDFMRLETEKNGFYHIHAAGKSSFRWMPEEMERQGVYIKDNPNLDLREYIYDMADVLAAADLVLTRAGASALAEICAVGRASIIVPSPFVTDNHQEKNARALEKAGAAVVLLEGECTGETLFETVTSLLSDQDRLRRMEASAKTLQTPDSRNKIYESLKELSGHRKT